MELQSKKFSNQLEEHMLKDIQEYEKKQEIKQTVNNYTIPNLSAIATAASSQIEVIEENGNGDSKKEKENPPRFVSEVSKFNRLEKLRLQSIEAHKERQRRDEAFRLKWRQEEEIKAKHGPDMTEGDQGDDYISSDNDGVIDVDN